MKTQDCWRLAKVSLQARKKATRNTVCGIALSLIIIIPLIFAIIATNSSVKSQINSYPELLSVTFTSSQKGYKYDESIKQYDSLKLGNSYDYPYYSVIKDLTNELVEYEKETIHYVSIVQNLFNWQYKVNENISFDGKSKRLNLFDDVADEYSALAVVSKNCLDKLAYDKMDVLGEEFNKGFTGDGKKQVILSDRYLAMAGLEPEDVYGKKITISFTEFFDERSDVLSKVDGKYADRIEYNLLQDFEVVGIIKTKVGKSLQTESGYEEIKDRYGEHYSDIQNANIIVSSASYYGADDKPAISHNYYVEGDKVVCDLGDFEAKKALTNEYVFCGVNTYNSYTIFADRIGNTGKLSGKLSLLEFHRYGYYPERNCPNSFEKVSEMLDKSYHLYRDEYKSPLLFRISSGLTSRLYGQYAQLEFFVGVLLAVFAVFSGIILIAALINLFNTIMHSVQSRKNYLGVMRAIGARSSDIPKLYFFEVLRLLCKAFIWIASLGGLLCLGVKFLVDYLFTELISWYISGVVISMPIWIIPIVILVFLAVLFVVGVIYAFGCSYKVAHDPIVKTLEKQ